MVPSFNSGRVMQILKVKEVLLDDTHLKVVPSIVLAEMFYLHIRKMFCPKCINVPECAASNVPYGPYGLE